MLGCSVVITTRNRAAALEELIVQLQELKPPPVEIIVVDNESRDNTADVASRFEGVRYCFFEGGLAEARHVGSIAAQGDYITYVDDDCKPGNEGIFARIVEAFQNNPQMGILGCKIQNVGFKGMQQFKGYTKFSRNAMLEFEPDPPKADVFASMAITIRKDVYEKIGGFDPNFSRGCEEVDLCLKVRAAGYELRYVPDASFYHHEMGSHFRFNPVHNRDYMRLYSFFKFFAPAGLSSWSNFLKNEWYLFVQDVKQIARQYSVSDFRSTHLPFINRLTSRSRILREIFRWPLMAGAVIISPFFRRLFIPYIYWKAQRRKEFERVNFGLVYA